MEEDEEEEEEDDNKISDDSGTTDFLTLEDCRGIGVDRDTSTREEVDLFSSYLQFSDSLKQDIVIDSEMSATLSLFGNTVHTDTETKMTDRRF